MHLLNGLLLLVLLVQLVRSAIRLFGPPGPQRTQAAFDVLLINLAMRLLIGPQVASHGSDLPVTILAVEPPESDRHLFAETTLVRERNRLAEALDRSLAAAAATVNLI